MLGLYLFDMMVNITRGVGTHKGGQEHPKLPGGQEQRWEVWQKDLTFKDQLHINVHVMSYKIKQM